LRIWWVIASLSVIGPLVFNNILFFAAISTTGLVSPGMGTVIKPLYFEAGKDFGRWQFFMFSREFKSV
jgi:hypothetical protein